MNAALVVSLAMTSLASADSRSIRSFDFSNAEYSWREQGEQDEAPHAMEWQQEGGATHRLTNGIWAQPQEPDIPTFAGMTLEEVLYGDLTGDRQDEAVVVLRYDTGGTMYYYWVYIYSAGVPKPLLLATFRSGARVSSGLSLVRIHRGALVVDLFDPEKALGACCSFGIVRTRYRWNGRNFDAVGNPKRTKAKRVSRRKVSMFGMPLDQMRRKQDP